MPAALRILLIAASIVTLIYITRKIRRAQLKLVDGFSWLLMSIFFIIISIWPQIIYWMCNWLGIISPINLVYLIVIFLLLMKLFFASIRISRLESRVNDLAQEVAIRDERFLGLKSKDRQAQEEQEKEKKEEGTSNG